MTPWIMLAASPLVGCVSWALQPYPKQHSLLTEVVLTTLGVGLGLTLSEIV